MIVVYLTVILILAVAYVNGWTDAPNSIAACVSTKTLTIKKAVKVASVADFTGSVSVGLLSGKVSEKIFELACFGNESEISAVSIFAAMLSVIIFSVTAWYFGIPTSESHALLAGIFGSSLAFNKGINIISINVWISTIIGLIISLVSGFISGYCLSGIIKKFKYESDSIFSRFQIISGILTAFMHGAQDSQKFAGILMATLSSVINHPNKYIINLLCAGLIALGTATGGERIIKTVGSEMVTLNKSQGFSADVSGLVCLFISTLSGLPVSTTHIKTASILGAGLSGGVENANKKTVNKMIMAWILTFPVCAFLSFLITHLIIN